MKINKYISLLLVFIVTFFISILGVKGEEASGLCTYSIANIEFRLKIENNKVTSENLSGYDNANISVGDDITSNNFLSSSGDFECPEIYLSTVQSGGNFISYIATLDSSGTPVKFVGSEKLYGYCTYSNQANDLKVKMTISSERVTLEKVSGASNYDVSRESDITIDNLVSSSGKLVCPEKVYMIPGRTGGSTVNYSVSLSNSSNSNIKESIFVASESNIFDSSYDQKILKTCKYGEITINVFDDGKIDATKPNYEVNISGSTSVFTEGNACPTGLYITDNKCYSDKCIVTIYTEKSDIGDYVVENNVKEGDFSNFEGEYIRRCKYVSSEKYNLINEQENASYAFDVKMEFYFYPDTKTGTSFIGLSSNEKNTGNIYYFDSSDNYNYEHNTVNLSGTEYYTTTAEKCPEHVISIVKWDDAAKGWKIAAAILTGGGSLIPTHASTSVVKDYLSIYKIIPVSYSVLTDSDDVVNNLGRNKEDNPWNRNLKDTEEFIVFNKTLDEAWSENNTETPREFEEDVLCSFCIETASTWRIVGNLLFILKILAPVVLIIMASIDLARAMLSSNNEEMKKSTELLIKRAIAGVIIFFIPDIVNLVFNLVSGYKDLQTNYSACLNCILEPNGSNCTIAVNSKDVCTPYFERKCYKCANSDGSNKYVWTYIEGSSTALLSVCSEYPAAANQKVCESKN